MKKTMRLLLLALALILVTVLTAGIASSAYAAGSATEPVVHEPCLYGYDEYLLTQEGAMANPPATQAVQLTYTVAQESPVSVFTVG